MTEENVFLLVALKEKIRQAKENGEKYVFFTHEGIERVFLVNNYGDKWIEKATLSDFLRVSPR